MADENAYEGTPTLDEIVFEKGTFNEILAKAADAKFGPKLSPYNCECCVMNQLD